MLCFAVKGIIYPTFIVDQTGDLLDLLAQLEAIRRHTVITCHHVLRLNESYKNDREARRVEGFALLPEDEEQALGAISSRTRQKEARKTYVSLITWSCLNVGPIPLQAFAPAVTHIYSIFTISWQKGGYVKPKNRCQNGTATILAGLFLKNHFTPTGMKERGGWWQTAGKT